jgi:pimeloyl-ACP methyl ester carboxylesterase
MPLPQRFVTVDGRKVHLIDVGVGPSIVLETGAGGAAAAWLPVIRRVSGHARVVAVDRPGAGWSDPGPEVLPVDVAARLRRALDVAGVPPPYVLVGHSLGGFHVRAFAAAYPRDAAALVLVDPSHEEMASVLDGGTRWQRAAGAAVSGLVHGLVVAPGTHRIAARMIAPRRLLALLDDDPSTLATLLERATRRDALRQAMRETRSVPDACAQMRALDDNSDVPMRLLSAETFDRSGQRPEARQAVSELHAVLAARWPDARHTVIRGTTHLMPIEHPDPVATAILETLAALPG